MASNSKTIAKNTAFLYFRMLVGMIVSFYTARVVLEVLGASDYGIYNVVGGVVTIVGFLNSALSASTSRFLAFELGNNNLAKLKNTFSAALNLHIVVALLVFLIGETIGLWFFYEKLVIPDDRIQAAFWVYQFSIITTMVSFTQVPYNASLIAHENMSIYAYVGLYESFSKLAIVYILTKSPIDKLTSYGLLLMINSFMIQLYYRYYTHSKYEECKFRLVKNKALYKTLLNYSGCELFGSLASVSQNQGVSILLNLFFGPVVNAARAISLQIQAALTLFSNNFLVAVRPQVVKLFAEKKYENMYRLTFYAIKLSYCLMLAMILPIVLESKYILTLWLGDHFPEITIIFTQIILIQALFSTIHSAQCICVHAIGKIKYTGLFGGSLLIMSLPINYLLFNLGAPAYVAFIIIIFSLIGLQLIEIFFIHRYVPFSISWMIKETYMPIFMVSVLALPLPLYLHNTLYEGFARLCLVALVNIIVLIPSVWIFCLNKETRLVVQNIVKEKVLSKIR